MIIHRNSGFRAFELHPDLVEALLNHNIIEPTPIQEKAIPHALLKKDIIGVAQTGTGKTLAFAVPIAQTLTRGKFALILAPTRELAQQIDETFQKLGLGTVVLIGGAPMGRQVSQLRGRFDVMIATPGRLQDHLNRRTAKLDRVEIVVLDEADRMFDMGFAPAIREILEILPKERQTMLFSATMPAPIVQLSAEFLVDPEHIEIDPGLATPDLVEQEVIRLEHEHKHDVLLDLLRENEGPILVFARTRHGARKVAGFINDHGFAAGEIHAGRSQAQREDAMRNFRSGRTPILVATDIAARGIDVKEISLVINFDMPDQNDDYFHRIGRTGRAGAVGRAVSFVIPKQARQLREIEKKMGKTISTSTRSTLAARPKKSFATEIDRAPVFPPKPREKRAPVVAREPRFERPRPARPAPRVHEPEHFEPTLEPNRRRNFSSPNQQNTTSRWRQDGPPQERNDRRSDAPRQDRPQQDRPYRGRNESSSYDRPSRDQRPSYDRPSQDRPAQDRRDKPPYRGSSDRFKKSEGSAFKGKRVFERKAISKRVNDADYRAKDRPRTERPNSDSPFTGRDDARPPRAAETPRSTPFTKFHKPSKKKAKRKGSVAAAPAPINKKHRGWTGKPKKQAKARHIR